MKQALNGSTRVLLVLVISAVFLLACDVASLISQVSPSTVKPSDQAQAQPTQVVGSKEPTPVPAGAKGATAAPTGAAKAAATETPTAVPAPVAAKVGQRIVKEGFALTVTKVDSLDTFGGKKADAGYRWIIATVTVENVTNGRTTVDLERFSYVDRDGGVIDGILNGPSAPGTTGRDVLGHHELTVGGKVQNKIIPIQMEQDLVAGSRLLFNINIESEILVDLGLK